MVAPVNRTKKDAPANADAIVTLAVRPQRSASSNEPVVPDNTIVAKVICQYYLTILLY